MINLKFGVQGHFKLEAAQVGADGIEIPGTRRFITEFDNLVLNTGLDAMADSTDYANGCVVGSGSTPPVDTDTALETFVAGTTSTTGTPVRSNNGSSPYQASKTEVFRFGTGVAAGNLSEIGISVSTATSMSVLFSRALITNSGGTPITITILPTEILDVTYTLSIYPPLVDVTGTVSINSISTDYTIRACTVTTAVGSSGSGAFDQGWGAGTSLGYTTFSMTARGDADAYTGTIGAITSSPGGTSLTDNAGNNTDATYSPGDYHRDITYTFGTATGNHASGIGAVTFCVGMGCFQMGFVPNVMKTSDDVFAFTIVATWDRHTP